MNTAIECEAGLHGSGRVKMTPEFISFHQDGYEKFMKKMQNRSKELARAGDVRTFHQVIRIVISCCLLKLNINADILDKLFTQCK